MGMAASQARLLTITARIHDVEYQAQSIQNAKIQLSTQSDQVYNEYLEALNASTLTVNTLSNDGSTSLVTANFNTLFSKNKVTPADGSNYALRENQKGYLVVEDSVYRAYEEFKQAGVNDPFAFAIYMLNDENVNHLGNVEDKEGLDSFTETLQKKEEETYNNLNESEALEKLHKELEEISADPTNIYSGPAEGVKEEAYQAKLDSYRRELYRLHSEGIYNNTKHELSPEEFDTDLLNYYASIFKQIQACGGCVPISDYNGFNGDATNNSDWLQAMIQSGKFSIDTVKTNSKTGEVTLTSTSPSSDISLAYVETSTIDKTAVAKAEAKYEHDLKQINQKDKQFDLSLSKLETERTALTTEYESVKKVIEENIERTFGIFS